MTQRGWASIGKILLALLMLTVAVAGVVVFLAIRSGMSARSAPTATEAMLARAMRRLAIPLAERNLRNPLPRTPQVLREGRDHFADHCATCHANDGSGKTEMGQNLYPNAPDMREPRTQELSDGEIFFIIRNGVRLTGMPAWGGEHNQRDEEDNWKLVHFIRHLPKITPAELDEMKRMNPISPHEAAEQEQDEEFLEGAHKNENH